MRAAQDAFRRHWPDAHCINLLDDSLPDDLRCAGPLDAGIRRRITTLLHYAAGLQVDGILFTGSGFGPLLDELAPALGVPLLKPNQAMYDEAHALAAARSGRLGMLVTFPEAAAAMQQDFEASRPAGQPASRLEIACAPDALDRLLEGDPMEHNRLLAEAAAALRHCDAILLAQFSSAQAAPEVAAASGLPVLTSPDSAVKKLRVLIEGR